MQRSHPTWARYRHFHFLSHTNDQKLDFWFGYFITVLRISFLPSLLKSRSIAAITLEKLELPVRKNGPCVFPVSSSFPLVSSEGLLTCNLTNTGCKLNTSLPYRLNYTNIHKHLRLLWLRTGLEAAILPDAESCYTFWVSRGRQLCKSRSSEAAAN